MIRVLLVEDSRAVIAYIRGLLGDEADIELLPPALTGPQGIEAAIRLRPDVVLMDLQLPELDGLQVTREIMSQAPTPIVVFSALLQSRARDYTFDSLQAGAVEVMAKPESLAPEYVAAFRGRLLKTIRLMATARVVRRYFAPGPRPVSVTGDIAPGPLRAKIIAIGSSTGGPPVLRELLSRMPAPAPLPMVVAQHIIPGFEGGLARWLAETGHRVQLAIGGDPLLPGNVYLSPADASLVVAGGHQRVCPPDASGPVPSADLLLTSVAQSYGEAAVGVLLTGMGSDGARGLAAIRAGGGLTLAQRGDTCVVDGMPAAARALNAVQHSLSPAELGDTLARMYLRAPAVSGPF